MTTRIVPVAGDISRARCKPPVAASAAWEDGDPIGSRLFAELPGGLELESGALLPSVTVAYETYGTLNAAKDNAILLLHALTGDAHVAGPAGPGQLTSGWWEELVGPGKPLDTDRYFIVVPNVLGGCSGTTGPSSRMFGNVSRETAAGNDGAGDPALPLREPQEESRGTHAGLWVEFARRNEERRGRERRWGGRFPRLTVRDQVNAEIGLAHALGLTEFALVIGASMGGLRALEWAIMGPEAGIAIRRLAAIATTAATSADQIAWAHPQLAAIRLDPGFHNGDYYDLPPDQGPHKGLGIARQIAHTTYRCAPELDYRFQRFPQSGENTFVDGRYAIQSYLDHHGDKLARRFDANTYIVLTEAIMTHDLGRDRGGTDTALSSIAASTLVVAVDSDRLYSIEQALRISEHIPGANLEILHSDHGHDGFLIEFDQLDPIIRQFLASEFSESNLPERALAKESY